MENLRKAIGDLPMLAVSSDACKGLENAMKVVFPRCEQRECFRHLMENYVKRHSFCNALIDKALPILMSESDWPDVPRENPAACPTGAESKN
jgi:hypothetical protein